MISRDHPATDGPVFLAATSRGGHTMVADLQIEAWIAQMHTGMSAQTNEQMLRRWFQEVWNEGRLETIDELMDQNGVAHDVTGNGMELRGHDEFKAATKAMRAAFQDIRIEVLDVVSTEDKVAMRLNVSLTHTGHLGELPPTGARVSTPLMCLVHIRDGRIVEGWNYWDIGTVLKAVAAPAHQTSLL